MVRVNSPFGEMTTYRTGGRASAMVTVSTLAELDALASAIRAIGPVNTFVLGNGSNTLVSDAGFDGLVIKLESSAATPVVHDSKVTVGGGDSLPVVSRKLAAAGLTGFEWAVGVPGTVGGAARMNAGGHGSDFAATFSAAVLLDLDDGQMSERGKFAMEFGYRHSSVRSNELIWQVQMVLSPGSAEDSAEKIAEIVRWRRIHQPGGQNAGSVFRNPEGLSAGRLVEEAGLKGLANSSAAVSEKHANFIQATKYGSSEDVLALMVQIREQVLHVTGIRLQSEVVLIGFSGEHYEKWLNGCEA